MIVRKSRAELEAMREGGRITAACLKMLEEHVEPGVTTRELDRLAEDFIRSHGGTPEFKGYPGGPGAPDFPASICASPNAMIVHGIPGSYRLKSGDIISLDVGVRYEGFVTDSARTVPVGEVPDEVVGLLGITQECLAAATEQMRAGNRLGDVGHAIQSLAESRGYGVVRELGGHGVGRKLHEKPHVNHFGRRGHGMRLREGMTFTIEPMLNLGSHEWEMWDDDWTVVTRDRRRSAQFEHTLLVTPTGAEVLTHP